MGALKLRNIGSSQGFVIPKHDLSIAGFSQNDEFELIVSENSISIIKRRPHHSEWQFKSPKLSKADLEWVEANLDE